MRDDQADAIRDLLRRADNAGDQATTNGCLILAIGQLLAIVEEQARELAQLRYHAADAEARELAELRTQLASTDPTITAIRAQLGGQ